MSPDAGYSGTPLPKKLGIKPGGRVLVLGGPPDGFLADVEDATVAWRASKQPADVIVLFVRSQAELVDQLPTVVGGMAIDGGLWVAWLFLHLLYLVGFRNRLSVLVSWSWSYLTWDRGPRLVIDPTAPKAPASAVLPPHDQPEA